MSNVAVSKDALAKVKTALNDYQTDISGLTARVEQRASDISESAEREMKKIAGEIDTTTNEIKRLETEINRLEEAIKRKTDDKESAEQKLKTTQYELMICRNDAIAKRNAIEKLKSKLAKADADYVRMGEEHETETSARRNIANAYAAGRDNPSDLARGVALGGTVANFARTLRDQGTSDPPSVESVETTAGRLQGAASAGLTGLEESMRGTVRQLGRNPTAVLESMKLDRQTLEELERLLPQIEAKIKSLEEEISELKKRIEKLEQDIREADAEKRKKAVELRDAKKHLSKLQDKQGKMKTAFTKLHDNMNDMLAASKSFETRAEAKTEKHISGVEKCIAAIEAYLT